MQNILQIKRGGIPINPEDEEEQEAE